MSHDWQTVNLGEVAEVQTGPFGSQLHESDYVKDGTPIITVENLIGGKIQFTPTTPLVSRDDVQRLSKYVLREGDVVFSRVGAVDRSAYCTSEADGWMFSGRILRVRPKNSLNPKYLNYYLSLDTIKNRIRNHAVGGTMASLNTGILNSVPIVHPPLQVQTQIVEILETWDGYLEKLEKKIELKKNNRSALLSELLSGARRLKGFETTWERVKLGSVSRMSSGGTPKSTIPEYYGGDVPWVSIADMTSNGKYLFKTLRNLTQAGLSNSAARVYPKGTILYAMYASIGECSIAGTAMSSSQAILGIVPNPKLLDNLYLYHYLTHIKNRVKLMGQQGTQANLNAGMVRDFEIYLPSLEEQKAIASILDAADDEVILLSKIRAITLKQKEYLVANLIGGKLRRLETLASLHKEAQHA